MNRSNTNKPRIKNLFKVTLLVLTVVFIWSASWPDRVNAAPGINEQINYQGKLLGSGGLPVAGGVYSIRFSLYDAAVGGNRVWTASGSLGAPSAINVDVSNEGLFSILLGSGAQNALSSVNWNDDAIYIGITVGSDSEMTPRKRFGSVAQAFNAESWNGYETTSSVVSGSSLLILEQTSADAAATSRATLFLSTSGTSETNDYLLRASNGSDVFTVNRSGSVTSTGDLFVANAVTVGSDASDRFVVRSQIASDLLPSLDDTYSIGTTTQRWRGSFSAVTSTYASIGTLSVSSFDAADLLWTNATGTNTTSTNLYASFFHFGTATGTSLALTGSLSVGGTGVCLQSGVNCPATSTPNLQQVTNAGNTTTNAIAFGGGTSTGDFMPGAHLTYDLGRAGMRWDELWVRRIRLGVSTWEFDEDGPTGDLVLNYSDATTTAKVRIINNLAVSGTTDVEDFTFTSATGTDFFIANATIGNLSVQSVAPTDILWTNATGTNATTTHLYANDFAFLTASGTNLNLHTLAVSAVTSLNGFTFGFATGSSALIGTLTVTSTADIASLNVSGTSTFAGVTFTHATGSNVTITNLAVSSSLTVGGVSVCLLNGTNCPVSSESDTLATVTARGNFATTSVSFYGGLTTSNLTATGTTNLEDLTVNGLTTLQLANFTHATGSSLAVTQLSVTGSAAFQGATIQNATTTNVTTTHLSATNANVTNLTVANFSPTGIVWTNATGTNTTSTNLYAQSFSFVQATGSNLYASVFGFGSASGTNIVSTNATTTNLSASQATLGNATATSLSVGALTVNGFAVCLADGTNCPTNNARFYAFDAVGNISIATTTWRDIRLDTNVLLDSAFSHTAGTSTILVNATGTYKITYNISVGVTSTAIADSEAQLVSDASGSFVAIPGSFARMYVRNATTGGNNASVSIVRTLNAGTSIKLQARRNAGTGALITLPNSVGVVIEGATSGTIAGSGGTLQSVTDAGASTTNAIQFAGGTSTGAFRFQSNIIVDGLTTLQDGSFGNASTTSFYVGGPLVVGGTTTLQELLFGSATGSNVNVTGSLRVNGLDVCLEDGTNCPPGSGTPNFQQVTNVGNVTTSTIQFAGGTSTGGFVVQGQTTLANAIMTNATATNIFVTGLSAVNGTSTNFTTSNFTFQSATGTSLAISSVLTVGGRDVCLEDGTNCSVTRSDIHWSYNSSTNTITPVTSTVSVVIPGDLSFDGALTITSGGNITGVPWTSSNLSATGFESTRSLKSFRGRLYAGRGDGAGDGDVYMCTPETAGDPDLCDSVSDWTLSFNNGATVYIISDMAVYNDRLYIAEYGAAAGNGRVRMCDPGAAGDVNACDNASDWTTVTSMPNNPHMVRKLIVFNGYLYAASDNNGTNPFVSVCNPASAGDATECDSATDWTGINLPDSGTINNFTALTVYLNRLYAFSGDGPSDGDVYVCNPNVQGNADRCDDQLDWSRSINGSYGDEIASADVYNNLLYMGFGNDVGEADLYACNPNSAGSASICDSTTDVYSVVDTGVSAQLTRISSMISFNGSLYYGQEGNNVGDGDIYEYQISRSVVSQNTATFRATYAFEEFNSILYAARGNNPNQGEVWYFRDAARRSSPMNFEAGSSTASMWFEENLDRNQGVFKFSHGIISDAGAFDLAEMYPVAEAGLEAGDVVSLDPDVKASIFRSTKPYDRNVFGVISTKPGFTLSEKGSEADMMPVALTGRVPVKISAENGPVNIGDPLTSASLPGYAMKATKPGYVIGRSLQRFNPLMSIHDEEVTQLSATGSILMHVSPHWWAGNVFLEETGSVVRTGTSTNEVEESADVQILEDSNAIAFVGSVKNTVDGTITNSAFVLKNEVEHASSSLFTIRSHATSSAVLTLSPTGDVAISGMLYPSDRGMLQRHAYIAYNGEEQRMRTNARGWGSTDLAFAETFATTDDLDIGDVVSIDTNGTYAVKRSVGPDDSGVIGVVATSVGFVAGDLTEGRVSVAITGQVMVKVTLENGPIRKGDALSPASSTGFAMRARPGATVIGIALDDYQEQAPDERIRMFVRVDRTAHAGTDVAATSSHVRSGFATIFTGSKSVRVTFESVQSYPLVRLTPYGLPTVPYGITDVSDTGFHIVLGQAMDTDMVFAWSAESTPNDVDMSFSDGTISPFDSMTGAVYRSELETDVRTEQNDIQEESDVHTESRDQLNTTIESESSAMSESDFSLEALSESD